LHQEGGRWKELKCIYILFGLYVYAFSVGAALFMKKEAPHEKI
jgi:hypothetical protein